MRLGRRQLDVLRAADAGKCRTHHAGRGHFRVNGLDDTYNDDVLDSLLDRDLITLTDELISGHVVEITDAGARELTERRRRDIVDRGEG